MLEQKLKDLNSQLRAVQTPIGYTSQGTKRRRRHLISYDYLFPGDKNDKNDMALQEAVEPQRGLPQSVSDNRQTDNTEIVAWPEAEEADILLGKYRYEMMPLFPFVMISADVTSDQLHQERPYLWKAVMLEACTLDGFRQVQFGMQLLEDLSEALLLRPKKSLDLLQGLLLYIAWYHHGLTSFQVTNLLGLARSLCLSLGFNETWLGPKQMNCEAHRLEQMRAYAGTYYLITSVFTTSRRPDALMSTAHLETICRALKDRVEHPTDELLVSMIKVQKLAHSICFMVQPGTGPALSVVPFMALMRCFKAQIESFKASLSVALRDHTSLMAHVHIAECLLYEVGIHGFPTDPDSLQGKERLELLWSLLGSLKSFLALRFKKSIATEWPRFLCIASVDFMYAFITCLKLITLQAPGWDLSLVRQNLGLGVLVERQIGELEILLQRRKPRPDGKEPRGLRIYEDPFQKLAANLKRVVSVLKAMPDPSATVPAVTQTTSPLAPDGAPYGLDIPPSLDPDAFQTMWDDDNLFDTAYWNAAYDYPLESPCI
ncbi:hypothetical protein TruAng_007797 [Truncatella angustata]|nr:hypothetical protein TruAng_007797 [Truncatella angustata]